MLQMTKYFSCPITVQKLKLQQQTILTPTKANKSLYIQMQTHNKTLTFTYTDYIYDMSCTFKFWYCKDIEKS